jgi:hypothetical protein
MKRAPVLTRFRGSRSLCGGGWWWVQFRPKRYCTPYQSDLPSRRHRCRPRRPFPLRRQLEFGSALQRGTVVAVDALKPSDATGAQGPANDPAMHEDAFLADRTRAGRLTAVSTCSTATSSTATSRSSSKAMPPSRLAALAAPSNFSATCAIPTTHQRGRPPPVRRGSC